MHQPHTCPLLVLSITMIGYGGGNVLEYHVITKSGKVFFSSCYQLRRHFLFQVTVFLTGEEANLVQRIQMLLGLVELAHLDVGDADVLMGAAVFRVQLQGLFVGLLYVPRLAPHNIVVGLDHRLRRHGGIGRDLPHHAPHHPGARPDGARFLCYYRPAYRPWQTGGLRRPYFL